MWCAHRSFDYVWWMIVLVCALFFRAIIQGECIAWLESAKETQGWSEQQKGGAFCGSTTLIITTAQWAHVIRISFPQIRCHYLAQMYIIMSQTGDIHMPAPSTARIQNLLAGRVELKSELEITQQTRIHKHSRLLPMLQRMWCRQYSVCNVQFSIFVVSRCFASVGVQLHPFAKWALFTLCSAVICALQCRCSPGSFPADPPPGLWPNLL